MKRKLKFVSVMMTMTLLLGFAPDYTFAKINKSGTNVMKDDYEDDVISRAMWLSELARTFEMNVEDENYPDNYFSDLDEESEYYYDVLLTVQFGVIDVEAGNPVYPDEPATREFAASTLNYCLGYQLENEKYSFSDVLAVSDCVAAQVAVNRGWLTLTNGKFNPNQTLTHDEMATMLDDAYEVWNSTVIDEKHDNTFDLKDDVIELSQDAAAYIMDDGSIYVEDTSKKINKGNKVAVFINDIPCVYEVVTVEKGTNYYIITGNEIDHDDAYDSLDMQGTLNADAMIFGDAADGLEVNFEEEQEETHTSETQDVFNSHVHAIETPINQANSIFLDKKTKLSMKGSIKVGDGQNLSVDIKMKNAKIDYSIDIKGESFVILSGNTDVDVAFEANVAKMMGIDEIPIIPATIPGVGGLDLSLEVSFGGKFCCTTSGKMTVGVAYSKTDGFRAIKGFEATSFSMNIEANASVGLKGRLGITGKLLPFNGYLYSKVGGKAILKNTTYASGTPKECTTFAAYLYAASGVSVSFKLGNIKKSFSKEYEIFNMNNSPIRIYHHYEDGKEVAACSHGEKINFFTVFSSLYWGSGLFGVSSSFGYDRQGKPVALYTYTLDDDGNATITGYKGNATILNIPEKIDGYTVVGIGDSAFANKKNLKKIILPDEVICISDEGFAGCSNLEDIILPKKLKKIGYWAFKDCVKLNNVKIPKKVSKIETLGANYRFPFQGCTGLTYAIIEDGMTSIPENIFGNCTNLKEVIMPESVTSIGSMAFINCYSLSKVKLPSNLISLGNYVFKNCVDLTHINVPKTIKKVDTNGLNWWYPFDDSGIEEIEWAEGITEVPEAIFAGCENLKHVELPDTITKLNNRCFAYCINLKSVDIPDSVLSIGASCFKNCYNLKDITLPKRLEYLGGYSFFNCDSITKIDVPCTLNEIDRFGDDFTLYDCYPFTFCDGIKEINFDSKMKYIPDYLFSECYGDEITINIPDGVEEIGSKSFSDMPGLKNVSLPNTLKEIGGYAFANCEGLHKIVLPNSIEGLAEGIFDGCTSLTDVTINDTRQNIMAYMFRNCTSLETINLPDTVTTIQEHAFDGCTSLKKINWSKSINAINAYTFNNCDSLTDMVIPDTVQSVGTGAFYDCDGLTKVLLPDSVTQFGTKVFYDCDALTNVNLGKGITSLPASTFEHCDVLQSLVVPYNVTTIAADVFKNCVKFVEITIPRATTSINQSAFSYLSKLTIYGVKGTYAETFANDNNVKFVDKSVSASEVKLSKSKLSIMVGESFSLKVEVKPNDFTDEITWKTTDSNIVSVNGTGVIKGIKAGTATIKVTVGNISKTCTVEVTQPVTSLYLNRSSLSMNALEKFSLEATVNPQDATNKNVKWESSDTKVATVDENGTVTALNKGTAKITATALDGSGIYKSCTLNVLNSVNVCDSVDKLESEHDYQSDCSDMWMFTDKSKKELYVTFDKKTETESGYDYIYIYDGNMELVGKYTGTELANATIKVNGNTIIIKLVSDSSDNGWGFRVTQISDNKCAAGHSIVVDPSVAPTCTNTGLTQGSHCSKCGEIIEEQKEIPATGHNYKNSVNKAKPGTNGTIVKICTLCKDEVTVSTIYEPKTITLSVSSFIYTGKQCKPNVTVKDSKGKVISPSNYTVTYTNNINVGTTKSKPTVKVTFKGSNYTGTMTKTFTINKADNKLTGTASYSKTASSKAQTFKLNIKAIGGKITYKSNDKNVKVDSAGKVTIAKNYSGQAEITVTAGNNNYKTVTKKVTITVKPAATTLKSVKNSTAKNASKGKLTIAWSKLSYVTGYQIQYSTSSTFKSGNKTVNVKGASNVSKTITGLAKNKTYYVRIRTYKTIAGKNVFSGWSAKKSVKIGK